MLESCAGKVRCPMSPVWKFRSSNWKYMYETNPRLSVPSATRYLCSSPSSRSIGNEQRRRWELFILWAVST